MWRLLRTSKLLNQWSLVVNVDSSLRKISGLYHDLVDHYRTYVSQWPQICSVLRKKTLRQTLPYKTLSNMSLTTNWGELSCFGRINSSYPAKGTRRVTLVKTPIVSHEWGKNGNDITTKRSISVVIVKHMFCNGQPSHGRDRPVIWEGMYFIHIVIFNLWIYHLFVALAVFQ
jgi:hypothetical protein